MIVCCPGCRVQYSHPGPEDPARTAQCSRCDERFPLMGARPAYVVLPSRDQLARVTPAGMDDPMLAAQIRGGAAIDLPEMGPVPGLPLGEPTGEALPLRAESADPFREADVLPVAEPGRKPVHTDPTAPSAVAERAGRRRTGREALAAVLAAALGASIALRVSPLLYADFWMWTGIGAGAGLLLGLAWIRMVERRR